MAPRENDVGRHHADDARIVPVFAGKAGIRRMSIGDQRRARLHVGAHEGFVSDAAELSAITARPAATRARVEVLRALAPGLRLGGVTLDDLDRSGNQQLPRVAGLE